MRRFLPLAIVLGAVLVAAVLILLRPEPPRREPSRPLPVVSVYEAEVRSGPIEVTGSGTVRPRAEIDLAAQVPGQVIFVSPSLVSGGRVRRGQLLIQIDSADFRNAVDQARAEVAQQQVAVIQAEEEAEIARAEYERFLARQRALGLPLPDSGPSRLVLRQPQLEAARAALARADAALHDAELALSRTGVVAPFDGVIRSEAVDVGSYVTPGQGLARIYASDEVEVVIPLTDGHVGLIPDLFSLSAGDRDRGVPAVVRSRFGGRTHEWTGYVDRAEAVLDEVSRTVDVVVRVPDPFGGSGGTPPLLVGQYAEVVIAGRTVDGYVVVPRSALRPGNDVWAVARDSTVRIVSVEVLQTVDDSAYVVGELGAAPVVITGGVQVVTEGMGVRIPRRVGR